MESQELTEDLGKLNILPNEEVKQDYPILCDKQVYFKITIELIFAIFYSTYFSESKYFLPFWFESI